MSHSNLSYYNSTFLDQARLEGDEIADNVVQQVFESGQARAVGQMMASLSKNSETLSPDLPDVVKQYFTKQSQLPSWAEPKRMQKGWHFFQLYAGEIISMLGYLSLPYCYAAADGAQVLVMSKRIYQDTMRRLNETGQFVLDVMQTNAFDEQGTGFISTLKVRLMHAAIRFHILRSKSWNMEWGLPINQEDMAGTIGAFSWISVRGLRKVGHTLNAQDAEDFLHLWNVIGHIMGVRNELLPQNGKEAFIIDKLISSRNFKKSQAGIELTQALLQYFEEAPATSSMPKGFAASYMRFLLGDKVADILNIPASNWTKSLLNSFWVRNALTSLIIDPSTPRNKEFYDQVRATVSQGDTKFSLPMSLGL